MFVLKHSIHYNNQYAYKYVNEVTKGQKVMKTGHKWKFDHRSKNTLPDCAFVYFDVCNEWKC
jgi:hypothetical protein